jgi:membrane-bound lytic murein transglycosylase D
MQSQPKTRPGRGWQWALIPIGGLMLLLLVWCHTVLAEPAPSSLFPLPDALRPNVTFWKRIFAVFDTNGGLLHDTEDVTLVYHVWYNDLPTDPPLRQGIIDEARGRYRAILETLADGKRLYLTSDEERVWTLFKGKQHTLAFRAAANNIHFQGGMRSRFTQGLVRSWAYLPEIERIFADAGLPSELTLLPHIESSFENRALSKVGAAGIWQIMPATGRRYLRVNDDVDERLNIRASTMAAAQILRENYEMLGTWPLAITAYNHGANGMKQAVATVGTTDFGVIVQRYRGPLFGFASQNFYAEFLAAIDLVKHYKHYFGDILFEEPPRPVTIEARAPGEPALLVASAPQFDNAPRPVSPPSMASISPPVVSTPMPAPAPPSPVEPRPLVHASPPVIPPPAPGTLPAPGKEYRVRPGDSLFAIAQRHGTTVATLTAMNGLSQRAGVRAGQALRLPAPPQPVVSAEKAPQKSPVVPVVATVTTASALPIQRTVLSTVTRVPASSPALLSGGSTQGIRLPELDERFQIKGDTMRVAAQEQINQYAEWLNVPVQRLLTLNHLSARQSPAVGAAVRLDFSKVSAVQFTQRRLQYHRSLEEEFLRRYRIGEVVTRKLKPGETLLSVSRQAPGVPLWLLQRYNTHLELKASRPGAELRIPKVVSRVS